MIYRNLYHLRGYYYFRIRVPQDLQLYFGQKEIKKSLGTKDMRSATFRVAALRSNTKNLFNLLRNHMLTNERIQELVHIYYTETLEELEQDRAEGFNLPRNDDELRESLEVHSIHLAEDREALAYGQHGRIKNIVDYLIEKHKIEIESGSSDYQKLCREIHKAVIKVMEIEIERMMGNYDNEHDRLLLPSNGYASSKQEKEKKVLLSSLIKDYVDEYVLAARWDDKTRAENQSILDVFTDIVGDIEIKTITRQKMTEVFQSLQRLPANRNKRIVYRDKSTKELLEMDIPNPMSPVTVNKYMNRISSLFKWAVHHEFMGKNPAERLSVKQTKKASEDREVYSSEDLQRLAESLKMIPEDKLERYWIPLIGMYSGMRLNEICQLYLGDIREVDGVWCFDVNGKADKKLKTASGERLVPIHPALLNLDFLEYVHQIKETAAERLWPNLKKGRDGYGQNFSKWFQRHNRDHITKDPKKVFHSLRHTLANNLKQQGVAETVIGEILGHTHQSITTGRYGKEYRPKVLLDALNELAY